jgi:hypothetical protein
MLIVAGTIEGFVSPTDIPAYLKYLLSIAMFGLLLLFVMRKSPHAEDSPAGLAAPKELSSTN